LEHGNAIVRRTAGWQRPRAASCRFGQNPNTCQQTQ
jgi:hypothetical protein